MLDLTCQWAAMTYRVTQVTKKGLLTALKGMPDMTIHRSKATSHVCFCPGLTLMLSTLPDPVKVCCEPEALRCRLEDRFKRVSMGRLAVLCTSLLCAAD